MHVKPMEQPREASQAQSRVPKAQSLGLAAISVLPQPKLVNMSASMSVMRINEL